MVLLDPLDINDSSPPEKVLNDDQDMRLPSFRARQPNMIGDASIIGEADQNLMRIDICDRASDISGPAIEFPFETRFTIAESFDEDRWGQAQTQKKKWHQETDHKSTT